MPDPSYRWNPLIYKSRGLVARYAIDRCPPDTYFNVANAELLEENAIGSRMGRHLITQQGSANAALPSAVQTLARLKSLLGATYRYAVAGQQLWRRVGDADGQYTQLPVLPGNVLLSGKRVSSLVFRPNDSAVPYVFFADSNQMLKDNGLLTSAQQMGIFSPLYPFGAEGSPQVFVLPFTYVLIDTFGNSPGSYTVVNISSLNNFTAVSTTLTQGVSPGFATVTVASTSGMQVGMLLAVGTGSNKETVVVTAVGTGNFSAVFANVHVNGESVTATGLLGTIAGGTTASISKAFTTPLDMIGGVPTNNADKFTLFMNISDVTQVKSITLLIDVADGSFTQGWYSASVPVPGTSAALVRLQIAVGALAQNGVAGQPGHTLHNVAAWKIQWVMNAGSPNVQLSLLDFYLSGSGGPNVTGGVPYDYRYTWYNINTGTESNPCVTMVSGLFVSPQGQPVELVIPKYAFPTDPQVTHAGIYRRGGTLGDNWRLLGYVPLPSATEYFDPPGTTALSYQLDGSGNLDIFDGIPDSLINSALLLSLTNDVPVTSALNVPLLDPTATAVTTPGNNTVTPSASAMAKIFPNQVVTIDENTSSQEDVIVQSVTATTFTAWFQATHSATAVLSATARQGTPVGIMVLAFGRAWFAGDPNNPDIIYYSSVDNVEAVPSQNFVEVGNPNDPVTGIFEFRGQVFAFTLSTVWQLQGANFASLVPSPLRTAAKHGMVVPFAFVETESEIWYLSQDGIYAFVGAASSYASEPIEWLWRSQANGPVVPADPTQAASTSFAYFDNEVFISYRGLDALRHRLVWSQIYKRWRNDDATALDMLVERDTNKLLYSDTTGLIFQDRVGFYDDGGWVSGAQVVAPFSLAIQTPALDQSLPKNPKVYNEITFDIDTVGLALEASLIFDDGTTTFALGTLQTNARAQVDFNVNSGLGRLSRNICLLLTGQVNAPIVRPVTVFQGHYHSTVEAQLRKSFDTYFDKYGTDEWKFAKQGWFEYAASDPAGITMACYLDGSAVPSFSFTLPQSVSRTTLRVRFPVLKGRLWRWVGTSPSDFQIYGDTHIEIKGVTLDKGYQRQKIHEQP